MNHHILLALLILVWVTGAFAYDPLYWSNPIEELGCMPFLFPDVELVTLRIPNEFLDNSNTSSASIIASDSTTRILRTILTLDMFSGENYVVSVLTPSFSVESDSSNIVLNDSWFTLSGVLKQNSNYAVLLRGAIRLDILNPILGWIGGQTYSEYPILHQAPAFDFSTIFYIPFYKNSIAFKVVLGGRFYLKSPDISLDFPYRTPNRRPTEFRTALDIYFLAESICYLGTDLLVDLNHDDLTVGDVHQYSSIRVGVQPLITEDVRLILGASSGNLLDRDSAYDIEWIFGFNIARKK